ncbi:coiled-coil domain-containing protein 97 [Lucilia sericata]|uniref:coiled-coil domain-containing protein 97 n=1 Tax=Lucilia sericata TaxID=13632 RepID=UPI0018A873EC|nr:coiled-coil domain-containing protein 97 [Lucilia sericata]
MTTTLEETTENETRHQDNPTETACQDSAPDTTAPLPQEIMNIMDFLSLNAKIMFKSQQRDEPELQQSEKLKVALDVYQRNPQTFLIRFGQYLEEKHLQDFARLSIADSDEEMHLMVKEYQEKLKTRQRDVKNRRYAALQKLIKEGEYFSEQEMMKRQPELYQELVGQYLSSKEKQQRDSYDVRNTTFSGILMHNLEQEQLNEVMKKAEQHVQENFQLSSTTEEQHVEKGILDNFEKEDEEIPINCRQQWGNFDNEQIACSTSKIQLKKSPVKRKLSTTPPPLKDLITADERELLRQEFISQMHEQFLTGQDEDFDYTNVDDNTQFDDLTLINQDKEDKYFEESDEEDADDDGDEGNVEGSASNKMEQDEESEDELDIYMSHLNKHHSLQRHN